MTEERWTDGSGDAPEPSTVLHPGPWNHREVSANGQRFHVAETGEPGRPLVLLLHGFPQYWYEWRHQLVALAAAGFHAVAPDLRGYGASDKPPRGYDGFTLTADVAALVRVLGADSATVVGHDWGGSLAWSVAALDPRVVNAVVVISMPHPARLREEAFKVRSPQRVASSYMLGFQVPGRAERLLTEDGASGVGRLLRAWNGGKSLPGEDEDRYRTAMLVPGAAHCALEYYRWALRSQLRPSGRRYLHLLNAPVAAPVLQLHGSADPCLLASTALGSGRYVRGHYEWSLVEGAAHWLPETEAELVSAEIVRWASRG